MANATQQERESISYLLSEIKAKTAPEKPECKINLQCPDHHQAEKKAAKGYYFFSYNLPEVMLKIRHVYGESYTPVYKDFATKSTTIVRTQADLDEAVRATKARDPTRSPWLLLCRMEVPAPSHPPPPPPPRIQEVYMCPRCMPGPSSYRAPPSQVLNVRVVKNIGKGRYGNVTLVRDHNTGRLFARKQLFADTKRRGEMIQNERRALARLRDNTGVAALIQVEPAGNGSIVEYLFLEFVPGGTLQECIDEGKEKYSPPVPWPLIRRYTHRLLQILADIHAMGFVHCDIKATNILVNVDGDIKITDFGSAVEVGDTGHFVGSILYSSPEAIANDDTIQPSRDVWSAGVTALEMILGYVPWHDSSTTQHKITTMNQQEFHAAIPIDTEADVARVIKECLVIDTARRGTAKELAAQIGQTLAERE